MRLVKNIRFVVLPILVGIGFGSAYAQTTDSVQRRSLQDVKITAKASRPSNTKSQAPVQLIGRQDIEQMNISQLSDAVQHFSGVAVKDYGGVGGIKTISARGLGSQFSTLCIDGFAVDDCQNGQPDLGRFFVDNVDFLSFTNGQSNDILQSAKILASSNVLEINTSKPEKTGLEVGLEAGSFGFLHPSAVWKQKITPKLSISLKGTYIQSDGDYPFTIFYTNSKKDSSSREYRQHSDMRTCNLEGNLFYDFSKNRKMSAKMY